MIRKDKMILFQSKILPYSQVCIHSVPNRKIVSHRKNIDAMRKSSLKRQKKLSIKKNKEKLPLHYNEIVLRENESYKKIENYKVFFKTWSSNAGNFERQIHLIIL